MARAQMRPVVGVLAATVLLALAGCGGGSSKKQPTPPDILKGAGSFGGDASAWFFQAPDGAALTVGPCTGLSGNCATLTGPDLGEQDYDAQLLYWSAADDAPSYLVLQAGKKYTVKLRAAASAEGKLLTVALEDSVYTVVGSSSFTLSTTPTVYTAEAVEIPATGSGQEVAIKVNVGGTANAGVTFQVDDLVVLEEKGSPPPPPTGNDLLTQGDFESSPDQTVWNHWSNDGGNATFAVENCSADGFTGKCMKITGSSFGSNNWSTQLLYWNPTGGNDGQGDARMLAIDSSRTYTVTFRARASADGVTLQPLLQGSKDAGYSPTNTLTQSLTTTATDHSLIFTGLTTGNLGFKMQFQSTASDPVIIEVDDIHLLEK